MIKDQDILCISSIDWDFIWQGHQEIMSTFARNGNRVLFIENTGVRTPGIRDIPRMKNRIKNWLRGIKGIREERENLYIFSPLILPFPYSRFIRFINRHLIFPVLERWMRAMDFSNPIIWTFLPTPLSKDITDRIINKLVVYYCIDNLSVSSASAKRIISSEIELLEKADLVFATSLALRDYCSKYSNKVYLFPFAVNFERFEKAREAKLAADEDKMANIKRPVIGYVGGIHKWLDQELIKVLAEGHLDWSFVFIGPLQTNTSLLKHLKNVYFLGTKDHDELPFFIKGFDIGIIPYIISDYTKNVYPTKLNEYLAMGKAVVCTALPEIIEFNKKYPDILYIARDRKDFSDYIRKATMEDSLGAANRRIAVAKENSWKNRIEEMGKLIEEEIETKKIYRDARWKESLLIFYKLARRKVLKIASVLVLLYLLLFKTSFIWFLASPLRISQPPQRVDAIVVFGGGVGETGSPGKSTIERARYAAGLYKEGYADKIIFSSGYAYTYNDAENMRLIALPIVNSDKDIILEERANSTYQNVIFSKEILDKNKWSSILLVSSPYNMRRAYLVFSKFGKNMKVVYAPVLQSEFYDKSHGVKLEQIKAIAHEYLSIVYYWFKGYI
jgi:uncharacterized SAM-binding protein YcdF (DUF218 family)